MNFDVIVVGGGLAGASLAVGLRATRLTVAVVEANVPVRPAGWDARIYAISPSNQAFLTELGIWKHLDESRLTPISEMRVFGDAGGSLRFSAYESGLAELAWIAESSLMHVELWATLKRQHNVTLFCPTSPSDLMFTTNAAELTLADGQRLRGRLIVAADGADSWVRSQAEIAARTLSYEETGVVANFQCERPHRNIAYQWFTEMGVLAYLPLPDNRISIVWSAPDSIAQELLALEGSAFAARVAEQGQGVLGNLVLEGTVRGFPLRMMRVERLVQPRLALIGDAAHTIHPLSGHGVNLGLQDARVLADRLVALAVGRDPGEMSLLRSYARARAEEPLMLQYATHGLRRLFDTRDPVVSALRNFGMNLTGRLPVLKDALVRYAANGRF